MTTKNVQFNDIINKGLSRRKFLQTTTTAAFFAASPTIASATSQTKQKEPAINFKPVPTSVADTVVVPEGYQAEVLISWGSPLFADSPAFSPSANSDAQLKQFGDNNDGMAFFTLTNERAVLAVNNEYTNYEYLLPNQGKTLSADDVKKAQAAVGNSIVELVYKNGQWIVNQNGRLNRRITANTPMEITGVAAGHPLLKTKADPTGTRALGTFANCANGATPWGTYLTCEENFDDFFGTDTNVAVDSNQERYGISPENKDYRWYEHDPRFDIAQNPNEPNRFGWVVEIDPMNPNSMPKKRTALGRFKHENAAVTINNDGYIVVYLGDDERGEHLYRFVSKHKYNPSNQEANRDLLEEGTLYVAKFDAKDGELKGTGQWIELTFGKNGLTPENGFASQAEIMIFARKAATHVGATTMDRPEWVAVNPHTSEVFCTLTNNKNRGVKPNQPVDSVNPRAKNPYGHILRWNPSNGNHTAETFDWDLYLIAGNPTVHKDSLMAGSKNINKDNMFNCPDGLGFDKDGRLWILTDGDDSNEGDFAGMGNNQMLCGNPVTGEIRRFLTGPIACEITGITFSHDSKTMFVGVQHPGEEQAPSHFPDGGRSTPRSSIMRITRKDGGVIGA
ncbi:PhoX family protein [Photobacterium leiognathi]|uniref:PhoX family protein n=1 Tax=Photobacterium leiognathi TaxID=553611 RepID=UPI002980D7FE|nr:PhoX family phosphatase [Photobacterium leiognathi]